MPVTGAGLLIVIGLSFAAPIAHGVKLGVTAIVHKVHHTKKVAPKK